MHNLADKNFHQSLLSPFHKVNSFSAALKLVQLLRESADVETYTADRTCVVMDT